MTTADRTPNIGWRARLPSGLRAFATPFEVEDVLLAAWVLLFERTLLWYLGAGRAEPVPIERAIFREDDWPPLGVAEPTWVDVASHVTALGWVMVAGWLFVVLTQGPEDRTLDGWLGRRFLVVPPPAFYALHVVAVLAWIGARIVGRAPAGAAPGSAAIGSRDRGRLPRVRPALSAMPGEPAEPRSEPRYWGPTAPRTLRRLAVVPVALLGESTFRHVLLTFGNGFRSELTLATLSWGTLRGAAPLDFFKLALEIFMMAGAFALLVAGPRIAAGSTLAFQPWIARFAMFAAATIAARGAVAG